MFDTMVAAHAPVRRRTRNVVITTSVAAHALALTAFAIAAMWNIDKLELDPRGVTVPGLTLPGDSGGGGMPQVAALVPKEAARPPKVVPKDTVQPDRQIEQETPTETAPTTTVTTEGGLGGEVPGNGKGGDGLGVAVPTEGTGCTEPPCGEGTDRGTDKPKAKQKVEPVVPTILPPKVAQGLRTSGNDQIPAPDSVRAAMLRENTERVIGTVKLCMDADGRIARASMAKSTGYDAYDKKLLGEMRLWRYRPYKVNGIGAPACTMVTVVYIMK